MSTSLFSAFVLTMWTVWIKADGCLQATPKVSLNQIEGSSVTLHCSSSSCGGDVSLVWFINGSIVPGMVQALQTFNLDLSRAGVYDCAARYPNGSLVEREWVANITVESIIAPPNQYALIGRGANLSCYIAQRVAAQINWYSYEDPSVNGSLSVTIRAVSLGDDHAFICSVAQSMTTVLRTVYLHVLVPPAIQFGPSAVIEITSNSPNSAKNVSLFFHSRPSNTTTVLWYKNGISFPTAANVTTSLGALEGNTALLISRLVRRGDGGVYTVVVRNSYSEIPLDMRTINKTFELKVKVPPATPSNVNISSINSSHVAITWSLYPLTPDENADSFTLELTPLNGDLASMRRVLQGGSRLAALQVAAGTNYTLRLTAVNVDGTVPTAPVLFSAPPEAPSIFSAAIYRLNLTTFCLTMNLLSNGGADVRALNISYRVIGAGTVWSVPVLMPVIQSAELSVRAVIEVTQSVADAGRMEFRMSALNALSFETSSLDLTETVELPGPPHLIIASPTTNLTVIVQLSEVGSPPLLRVVLVVTSLTTYYEVTKTGPFLPGAFVPFTLSELTNCQGYIFAAYTVNYAGPGPSTPQATYSGSTMAPLWVLMISVLGVLILIMLAMMTLLGLARYLGMKQKHPSVSEDSISTSVRTYPPQCLNHVDQSSPDSSDTKAFVTALSTPSDTSPSDRLKQPECQELYVTMSKCSKLSLADELFVEHSSKPTFTYATYV